MLWSKKEDKKQLPDLPAFNPRMSAPSPSPQPLFPSAPEEDEESQPLPAFPNSQQSNRFSQAAIKEAVRNEDHSMDEDEMIAQPTRRTNVVEMDDWNSHDNDETEEHSHTMSEIPPWAPQTSYAPMKGVPQKQSVVKGTDVFVKIDKYHALKRMLDEAKTKLEQIDGVIKNIRELKMREEQELSGWEKELMHAKSRIQEVNQTIFEKTE